mgnify:FL=1
MKMYECTKEFKTTLFDNNETERIKIEVGSLWFYGGKMSDDRLIFCNNKIELTLCEKMIKEYFKRWG